MCAQITTLINGEPTINVDARDRGFQYGDGAFETIAVYQGTPLLWERHVARLIRGAERLGIVPPSESTLRAEAMQLCTGAQRAVLKIILTRGIGSRGYAAHGTGDPTRALYLSPWPDYPREFSRSGISICLCQTHISRNTRLAGIKHLNRLEQILARSEWHTEYADGVMCDEEENVIEGTMSNVFLVTRGTLRTPDVSSGGVAGIMREIVLETAKQLGIQYGIGRVTLAELDAAEEVFVTNSLIGMWPVRQFRETGYGIGPITRKIQEAIRETHCFDRQ